MINRIFLFSLILVLATGISKVFACTNLIVTKGASADGSVKITYAADLHTRYGAINFYPVADHQPRDLCEVYHYENRKVFLLAQTKLVCGNHIDFKPVDENQSV